MKHLLQKISQLGGGASSGGAPARRAADVARLPTHQHRRARRRGGRLEGGRQRDGGGRGVCTGARQAVRRGGGGAPQVRRKTAAARQGEAGVRGAVSGECCRCQGCPRCASHLAAWGALQARCRWCSVQGPGLRPAGQPCWPASSGREKKKPRECCRERLPSLWCRHCRRRALAPLRRPASTLTPPALTTLRRCRSPSALAETRPADLNQGLRWARVRRAARWAAAGNQTQTGLARKAKWHNRQPQLQRARLKTHRAAATGSARFCPGRVKQSAGVRACLHAGSTAATLRQGGPLMLGTEASS